MKLWTIQSASVLRALRRGGVLHVDRKQYREIPAAYEWVAGEMVRRKGWKKGHLPWWFYCRKPSAEKHRRMWPAGRLMVVLELDVARDRVFVMPSWAWNLVYLQDYLAVSKRELSKWERDLARNVRDVDRRPLPGDWNARLRSSWERLFTRRLPASHWDPDDFWSFKGNVAITEALDLGCLVSAKKYIGTSKLSLRTLLAASKSKRKRLARSPALTRRRISALLAAAERLDHAAGAASRRRADPGQDVYSVKRPFRT